MTEAEWERKKRLSESANNNSSNEGGGLSGAIDWVKQKLAPMRVEKRKKKKPDWVGAWIEPLTTPKK